MYDFIYIYMMEPYFQTNVALRHKIIFFSQKHKNKLSKNLKQTSKHGFESSASWIHFLDVKIIA